MERRVRSVVSQELAVWANEARRLARSVSICASRANRARVVVVQIGPNIARRALGGAGVVGGLVADDVLALVARGTVGGSSVVRVVPTNNTLSSVSRVVGAGNTWLIPTQRLSGRLSDVVAKNIESW